ncbi:hypothetical protein V6Z12_D10G285900 [Gossypium hirsutum]
MMQNLWVKGDDVCCVHPGGNGISGYDSIMKSWKIVWMNFEFPLEIKLKNVRVHVRGFWVCYVHGICQDNKR